MSLAASARSLARRADAAMLALSALATSSSACLLTETPQFTEPRHTRPLLLAGTANPDPRAVVILDTQELAQNHKRTFSAGFLSQDDPDPAQPFHEVRARLYIDYGFVGVDPLTPYRYVFAQSGHIAPGTLGDTTLRRASVDWFPEAPPIDAGCHTATLIVSHLFDDAPACPVCDDDYTAITWQVLRCDSSMNDCDRLPLSGCPILTNSCDAARAAGAGSICPETADEGGR